jgi:alpha-amylase
MTNFFDALRQQFRLSGRPQTEESRKVLHSSILDWLGIRTKEIEAAAREPINGVILQSFHWYLPNDRKHWGRLTEALPLLASAGFTALWLPPASKGAAGTYDVGYGVYDLYDLGEFNQKGTVSTKYGTKDEYVALCKAAASAKLDLYADVVFNHKLGGDKEEEFEAIPVAEEDRNHEIGPPEPIKSYTHYEYADRSSKYSSLQYHWQHFDAVDYNSKKPSEKHIYRVKDKSFATKVELEKGNYDYLMGCDVDVNHPEVKADLLKWGEWMLEQIGVHGFRLDAIKHIHGDFFRDWLGALEKKLGRTIFAVGEYWTTDANTLNWYIANTEGRLSLFDVVLHYRFAEAGAKGRDFDMRTIFDGSLVQRVPILAVTFVDNHDTQPLASLQSTVADWFKPLAYAVILLRADGYPCVFYADYLGAEYEVNQNKVRMPSHRFLIDRFLAARHDYAYGVQKDYFDHGNVVGWTRLGSEIHPGGLAVVLSTGENGTKWMDIDHPEAIYDDATGHVTEPVKTNKDGWGEFRCLGGKVSVWVPRLE